MPASPPLPTLTYDPVTDRAREECGVFGVRGADKAAVLAAFGLQALQHRGQEACGITSYDNGRFHSERHQGLVADHFTDPVRLDQLAGSMAIGHVRYSTSGAPVLRNVQPLYADVRGGGLAIAHNGNLTNARILREELVQAGAIFQSTSDTEVVLQLAARSRKTKSADRLLHALKQVEGAFALVAISNDKLIGARDPFGIRPLVMGELEGAVILASETCALDMIGARLIREIEPGEAVIISDNGIESVRYAPARPPRPCAFEYIYFARPDSVIAGRSVYDARKRMGRRLAEEAPADIDVVVPVPDSGIAAALGYAEKIGKPFDLGIIRAHFVGRTFIQPTQAKRDLGVRRKHAANAAVLKGKRVLLIDDSIVRGTTSKKIVRMVREAGATEVHFRSACPPITHPDFYGIDMPMREELMAASHDPERMRTLLECDSLGFLSVEGLYWAVCDAPRNDDQPQLADHYFTGEYPTRLADRDRASSAKDQQLSLLVDA
ncbi:amidophosphoribosyltransferase [Glycocaulis alkaliphilus]|uniref:Amidophosphoribosyltransferase n=1 Tax=Glycocaulis alkaliphilus TaxID=1434191 RepID=A0A3T0E7Y1_9PROT|nr:amidophosphoribosyltransferase [Glycocaulis alkaliphilus]AZU03337.1 amidophosphoribosyltransferase [Glycocaulis alkaliphilus]GGB72844.1 amidophosphoribosyltransferase [Glycocaulis alkaliphilus]